MTFTLFDVLILTIMTVSSLMGFYRGVTQIVISLLGFVASIIVAIILYPYVIILLSGHVKNELVISILSGSIAYIISLIIFTFITTKIISLFSDVSQGAIDRIFGLIIGVVRGVLISFVIFVIITIFTNNTYSKAETVEDLVLKISEKDYPDWLKESVTTPYLEKYVKLAVKSMPKSFLHSIELPKGRKQDQEPENIIDSVNGSKSSVVSLVEPPLDDNLSQEIKSVLSN